MTAQLHVVPIISRGMVTATLNDCRLAAVGNVIRFRSPHMSDMVQAALDYAARGWLVFPAPSTGEKKSCKSARFSRGRPWGATIDPEEIRRDFRRWPQANIGIVTGPDSNIWVYDVDTVEGHGVDGIAAHHALEAQHEPLPETLQGQSPSGSLHYYFESPLHVTIKNSTSKVARGIDVKGIGGMVLAPPSVRPGKGVYRWLNEAPIVAAPQWLIELVTAGDSRDAQETNEELTADPERVARALDALPNEDLSWNDWTRVILATFNATAGSDAGFEMVDKWSQKSPKYNAATTRERWAEIRQCPPSRIGAGSLFYWATIKAPGWEGMSVDDFRAYMPKHTYIFVPSGAAWPAASVDGKLPHVPRLNADGTERRAQRSDGQQGQRLYQKPSAWLDKNQSVEQATWEPGKEQLIRDQVLVDGGWIPRLGVTCFNLYRPPIIERGDPYKAIPYLKLGYQLFGSQFKHFLKCCAFKVQHPEIKINHCILMVGDVGIGKDTLLEPLVHAVGPWNFKDIRPDKLFGDFTPFVKSVVLRINEIHDLGDVNRQQFYERMKTWCAAPPLTLEANEKHLAEYSVRNCCLPILTSNHLTTGYYIPAGCRRTYVMHSKRPNGWRSETFWNDFYRWYDEEGFAHVAAYFATLDVSSQRFNPKAPPPKTEAFYEIVGANQASEETELDDLLDRLGEGDPRERRKALTLRDLIERAQEGPLLGMLSDLNRNRRLIPPLLNRCHYTAVRNPSAPTDGLWRILGKRQSIYARADLLPRDQITAARELVEKKEAEAREHAEQIRNANAQSGR